jgi:EAL and modified HD-GYP domain-containing signal transduction protein
MTNDPRDTPSPSLGRLFLGRQPILDANDGLIGYELLFRDSDDNRAGAVNPGMATADVVCKAFTDLGLNGSLEGYKAFIIADGEFLAHDAIEALPPDGVILEVDGALAARPDINARCRDLEERKYAFCLLNPAACGSALADLLKRVAFVKLNVKDVDTNMLGRIAALPIDERPILIASHVETKADRDRAAALGFQFFQGYFFAEPTLVEGKKLDPVAHGLIRIINLINQDAELSALEQAFKAEAALTVKLLRLTNSVGVGLRTRIGSVRQAITIIGRRPLLRWLQLLLYSRHGDGDFERNPLMQLAALKGGFMERLAQHCHPRQMAVSDQSFLAGLMSLMPAALGIPMQEILDQIPVAPALRQALLERGGEIGQLLELTDCYDNDDPVGTDRMLATFGNRIRREMLNQCLADSIAWVRSLGIDSDA